MKWEKKSKYSLRGALLSLFIIPMFLFAAEPSKPVNPLKASLKSGQVVIGPLVQLPSVPLLASLAQPQVGFDWVWIDLEHGSISAETLYQMMQVTKGSSATPVVRVQRNNECLIGSALDAGAKGIMVPFVNSREEAESAISALRYPPQGERGYGSLLAAEHWGMSMADYLRAANDEVLAILQIEHIDAVENIDDILSVPGIDLIFIGPGDLAGSIGLLGQKHHPKVEELIQKVVSAAQRTGTPLGTIAVSSDDIERRIQQGFQFLAVTVDSVMIRQAAQAVVKNARSLSPI